MTSPPSDRTQTVRGNLANTYTSQAHVEGLFTRAVGDSAIADNKKKDAASAAWIALAEDAVRVVPFGTFVTTAGGGEVAKAVVNFTVNRARGDQANAARERWGALTGEEINAQTKVAEQARDSAEHQILTTLASEPSLMARPMPDNESSPGGRLMSLDEMGGLGSGLWKEARSNLLNPDSGVGRLFDLKDASDFALVYKDEFNAFYDK